MIALTDEGSEDEEKQEARILAKEVVDRHVENRGGGDSGGDEDLRRQYAVDLAYESPSQLILAVADSRVEAFPGLDVDVSDLDVIGGADAGVGVHLSDLGAAVVVGGDDGWIILLRLSLSRNIAWLEIGCDAPIYTISVVAWLTLTR